MCRKMAVFRCVSVAARSMCGFQPCLHHMVSEW
ncbi:Uncharacterised protein [Vibrio cholerae]|nr:Uncharacterised protein [Vibrio cholerae]